MIFLFEILTRDVEGKIGCWLNPSLPSFNPSNLTTVMTLDAVSQS